MSKMRAAALDLVPCDESALHHLPTTPGTSSPWHDGLHAEEHNADDVIVYSRSPATRRANGGDRKTVDATSQSVQFSASPGTGGEELDLLRWAQNLDEGEIDDL